MSNKSLGILDITPPAQLCRSRAASLNSDTSHPSSRAAATIPSGGPISTSTSGGRESKYDMSSPNTKSTSRTAAHRKASSSDASDIRPTRPLNQYDRCPVDPIATGRCPRMDGLENHEQCRLISDLSHERLPLPHSATPTHPPHVRREPGTSFPHGQYVRASQLFAQRGPGGHPTQDLRHRPSGVVRALGRGRLRRRRCGRSSCSGPGRCRWRGRRVAFYPHSPSRPSQHTHIPPCACRRSRKGSRNRTNRVTGLGLSETSAGADEPRTLQRLPRPAHRQTHPEPAHGLPGDPPAATPLGSCISGPRVTVLMRCAHIWGSPMIAPSSEVMSCQAESRVRSAPRPWRRSS